MPPFWIILMVISLIGLPTLLLVWGGSLLYRALDGDRFVRRGRVRGRWVNRVSRRLLALGGASILIGSGIAFGALMLASEGGYALWLGASTAVFALAVVVISWSWAGRRSAGRERCPRCSYDVSAVDSLTCPECGFVAESTAMWHKPRKRKRGLVAGAFLAVVAALMLAAPLAVAYGWRKLVPTNVLIAGVAWLPETLIAGDPSSYFGGGPSGSLTDRILRGDLSAAQVNRLSTKLADRITGAGDADDLAASLTVAGSVPIPIAPAFTPEEARRFIDRALLDPTTQPRAFFQYEPRIDWSGLFVLGGDEARDASRRLAALAAASPPSAVNAVRWTAAIEFADDPLPLLLDLMRRHQTDRWLEESTPISAVFRAWESRPNLIARPAWEVILSDTDPASRSAALRVLQLGRGAQMQIPSELADRVMTELLARAGAHRAATGEGEAREEGDARLIESNINLLLTQAHLDAVADRIRADRLTTDDLTLLAIATEGVGPASPTAIDPTLIVALLHHDRSAVRCAAADYLVNNWYAYEIAHPDESIDAVARAIYTLDPSSLDEERLDALRRFYRVPPGDE